MEQPSRATAPHDRSKSYTSVCGSSWFDVRVFYVRVMSCFVEDAPEFLTMWFPVRSIDIALEVNGGRVAPSEEAGVSLRRDRLDAESEEVTYVSTDNLRTSGSLAFEIYDRQEFLVWGNLKQSVSSAGYSAGLQQQEDGLSSRRRKLGWRMECSCEAGTSKRSFVRVRHDYYHFKATSARYSTTCMEVCVVGKYLGSPVILTQTVQLNSRRSRLRCAVLDAIPEDEEYSRHEEPEQLCELLSTGMEEGAAGESEAEEFRKQLYGGGDGGVGVGVEEADGEVSWFNAGVRVGVGIGLGMCLGVGIGVGLLVRTYNATVRSIHLKL